MQKNDLSIKGERGNKMEKDKWFFFFFNFWRNRGPWNLIPFYVTLPRGGWGTIYFDTPCLLLQDTEMNKRLYLQLGITWGGWRVGDIHGRFSMHTTTLSIEIFSWKRDSLAHVNIWYPNAHKTSKKQIIFCFHKFSFWVPTIKRIMHLDS